MTIPKVDGFDIQAPKPTDKKHLQNSLLDLFAIAMNIRYPGMRVIVTDSANNGANFGFYELFNSASNTDPLGNSKWVRNEVFTTAFKNLLELAGTANGVALLNSSGKIDPAQIGNILLGDIRVKNNDAGRLAITDGTPGITFVRQVDDGKLYLLLAADESVNENWAIVSDAAAAWEEITGRPSTFPPAIHVHDISDVSGLADALGALQQKEAGKGLSERNFTLDMENKLAQLSQNDKGRFPTWELLTEAYTVGLPGWYAIVDAGIGSTAQIYIWDDNDLEWVPGGGNGASTFAELTGPPSDNPLLNDIITTLFAQLATKASSNDVDAARDGFEYKISARAATPGNIVLSGLQTIDDVILVADDRVLVRAQTNPAENGIYLVKAGAWVRTSDANTAEELFAATLAVREGTLRGGKAYTQTTTNITLGTSPIVWALKGGDASFAGLVGDPSDNILLANALSLKANDSAVVKLTGAQTVAGVKTFSDGIVAAVRYVKGTDITGNITLDSSNAANYANKLVYVTAAAQITIANNAFTANDSIKFIRRGAGEVEFLAGAGVTRHSGGGRYKIAEQYEGAELFFVTTSEFNLTGATKA